MARRFADRLKNGDIFVLYVSLYSFGRFFVETLRVDPAFLIGGTIRGNLFVSSVLALGFAMILLLRHSGSRRKRPESSWSAGYSCPGVSLLVHGVDLRVPREHLQTFVLSAPFAQLARDVVPLLGV